MKRTHLIGATMYVIVRLFFVLCFLITLSACSDSIERGAGVSKVDWLPDSAGDISFWISGETRYYDFHISEKEFDKWILSRGYELGLDPSTGFPYTDDYVKSCHYYDHNAGKLSRFNVEGEGYVWIQNRGEDGGGYTVVYDREKQRAYFAASTH